MSKQAELVKNTIIIAIGKFSTQLIGFLLLPLYTHFLNPSEYGFYDLLMTYIVLLAPALTLQLEAATFRFLVDARTSKLKAQKIVSNISYIVAPIVLAISTLFSGIGLILGYEYTGVTLLVAVAMIVTNLILQIARGLGENKQYAIACIIIAVATSVSAVLFLAILSMKIDGILLSIALSNLLGAAYLFYRLRIHKYVKRGLCDPALQKEIVGYSAPLVPDIAAWWVINASGRTIITIFLGVAANGIYAAANKYSAIFNGFFNIFGMSWTESASMHINADDRDAFFSDVYNTALRLFASLGFGLIAVMPYIFPWFVSQSFNEAYLYIPVLVVAALLNAIAGLYAAIYIAKKLTKKVLNTSLFAAVINVFLTVSLVPLIGLFGAAISTALAFLAMVLYRHFDIKKYVHINYETRLFIIIPAVYVVIIWLYHSGGAIMNGIGILIAVIAALALNKKIVKAFFTKTFKTLKR